LRASTREQKEQQQSAEYVERDTPRTQSINAKIAELKAREKEAAANEVTISLSLVLSTNSFELIRLRRTTRWRSCARSR
jgi:hypothetical protein